MSYSIFAFCFDWIWTFIIILFGFTILLSCFVKGNSPAVNNLLFTTSRLSSSPIWLCHLGFILRSIHQELSSLMEFQEVVWDQSSWGIYRSSLVGVGSSAILLLENVKFIAIKNHLYSLNPHQARLIIQCFLFLFQEVYISSYKKGQSSPEHHLLNSLKH